MGLLLDSWWNVGLVALFGSCVYIFDWIIKKLQYFEKNKTLHVKQSLKELLQALITGANIDDFYDKLYHMHPEANYLGYYRGVEPSFIIRDPKLIHRITTKHFSTFHKRWPYGINESVDTISANLIKLNGDAWQELRFKQNPAFSPSKLRSMFGLLQSCGNSLVQQQRKLQSGLEEDIEAKLFFSSYSLAVAASYSFGIEPDTVKDPDSTFRCMVARLTATSSLQELMSVLKLSLPFLGILIRSIPKEVKEYFVNIVKKEINKRKSQDLKKPDFVQLLMELDDTGYIDHIKDDLPKDSVEKPAKNILSWTDELLTAQLLQYFISGYETTNQMIAVACYHLSRNSGVQQRLRCQIKAVKKKHQIMNYDSLEDMKLIDCCISESLRLMPIKGHLMRVSTDDYHLGDGKSIKKGTTIIIPVQSLQRDGKFWQNPDKYLPDRFIENDIIPGTYLPFGLGARACIGQKLAILQTKLMLAKMIENFQILPSDKSDLAFKRGMWFNSKIVDEIWIRLKPIDLSTI